MMQQSAAPTRTHLTVALHDGRAGNARQALALAHALDLHAAELVLQPRAPWRWLAPRILPGAQHGLGPAFHARYQAAPQLAIGCGRQAALATLRISIYILIGALFLQAILSWVSPFSPLAQPLSQLTRPFLDPIRRIVPPIAMVDLSPLIAILLAQAVLMLL